MFTVGEQQELRQIEEGLRDTDHRFAWRLALFQGVLRWAAPGRRAYLPVLAVLAAALLRLVAAAGRLLLVFAEGGMLVGPATPLLVLGYTAWPDSSAGQPSGHTTSPPPARPQPDGTDP